MSGQGKMIVPPATNLRGRRIVGEQREKLGADLLSEYKSGSSIREIAIAHKFSIGRTRRLLLDAGAEFRGRGGSRRTPAGE